MHEASLINDMLYTVEHEIKGKNVKKITALKLNVGEMSGALPDALDFAFMSSREGIFSEARLELVNEPVTARCSDCGEEYNPKGFPYVCPECGGNNFRLIKGEDVYLSSIEYEV